MYKLELTKLSPLGWALKYSKDKDSWAGNSFSSKLVVLLNSRETARSQTAHNFWNREVQG